MIPKVTDNPRPVPLSTGLVVKKVSKILSIFSGGMPMPVSNTETTISSSSFSKLVVMLMVPSVPIAS